MSTTGPTPAIDLDEIAHTISQSHPDLEYRAVRDEVAAVAPRYADATVPDFIPVLIERAVKARLRR